MTIILTDVQIQEVLKTGCIRIFAKNKALEGFHIYLEFGKELGFEYGEICAPDCSTDAKDNNYVFNSEFLSLAKQEPPYHPHSWTEYVACPKCFTPMIYKYDYCPKYGKASTGVRKDRRMNKLCCFITGGHKYKSSDLECKFDDEGIVRFINHCDKCGKIYEVSVPQISILRDFHKGDF